MFTAEKRSKERIKNVLELESMCLEGVNKEEIGKFSEK
jgi:hypothetical protein